MTERCSSLTRFVVGWLLVAVCVPVLVVAVSVSSALVWLYHREVALWKTA